MYTTTLVPKYTQIEYSTKDEHTIQRGELTSVLDEEEDEGHDQCEQEHVVDLTGVAPVQRLCVQ